MTSLRCPAFARPTHTASQRRWFGRLTTMLALLVAATATAQEPTAAAMNATLHLPAGDYSVSDLLDQAEMAARRRIARPDDLAQADGRLHLHMALELDNEGWQDVLGAMLWSRDLVLARHANGDYEVFASPCSKLETDRLIDLAHDFTLKALFDRCPYGPVRITLPGSLPAEGVGKVVGIRFGFMGSRHCRVAVTARGEVTIAGLGTDVRLAMYRLSGSCGCIDVTAYLPATGAWPRDAGERRIELRKGQRSARDLIDLLANELHRNVLVAAEADYLATPIEIETTRSLDVLQLEEVITRLLWDADIALILPLAPKHSLYQAHRLADDDSRDQLWGTNPLAIPMSVGEVMARKDLVAHVSVSLKLQHLTYQTVHALAELDHAKLRDARHAAGVIRQVWCFQQDLCMSGLTMVIEPVLVELAEKDVPVAGEGKRLAKER